MKISVPLSVILLSSLTAYGAPNLAVDNSAQAALSQRPFLGISGDEFRDVASEWLDDAKKAILKGKKNLEKWYHQGREYIKQDNLLCESCSRGEVAMVYLGPDR